MIGCFSIGFFLFIFPWNLCIMWICRLLAWVLFSPFMKFVDYFFIMKYYPQPNKETNELTITDLSFDHIFESPRYKEIARKAKIAKEEGIKLNEMRKYRFGEYIEEVPLLDSSLYPFIPLPTSTARPYYADNRKYNKERGSSDDGNYGYEYLPREQLTWQTFSGQKLYGKMVPSTHMEIDSEPENVQSLSVATVDFDNSIAECEKTEIENTFDVSEDEIGDIKNKLEADYPEDYLSLSDDYIRSVASKPYSKNPNVRRPLEYTTQKLKDLLKWRAGNAVGLQYLYSIINSRDQDIPDDKVKLSKALANSLNYSFMYWHGLDKTGRPVLWIRTDRMV